ncbi:polyprenol monophosphomannose synthase [Frigoribacterium faeni]|uniref:Dolichol-phosphate mannosyltransferase n=1 Tax=Frigoribacterium faeni TaxID=145483 RepID=A0A7W3JGE3_9MICO|nr:polyprenol monophosphomannose synthase [Frigoribacterium faeni]MBA8812305.1 dolichol-phosphate mannosyltransferase [Frigoribacterium faeni]GEK83910.1 dolichol-phosphate mannosyltransferase [Frigoribacterium faeni]
MREPVNAACLAIVPTYDEAENIRRIVDRILEAVPTAHVLVMDDASPDGTGRIADEIAAADDRVSVVHRAGKEGLGAAYVAGFRWGLDRGYRVLVEIDADGSHPADRLPAMLEALDGPSRPGLVIGSRWVPGGSVVNWPRRREFLSRAGNLYSRLALRISVRDATAGFRAYRADVLAAMPLERVASRGYFFQVDMTLRTLDAGHTVVEVPIEFREREAGVSKMSGSIVQEAMLNVTVWGAQRAWRRIRGLPVRSE